METHNFTYNSTLELWEYEEAHEWCFPLTYDINGTCVDTNATGYDATDYHNITIYSDQPEVYFESVTTDCDTYSLVDDVVIEYCSGNWSWTGAIVPAIATEIDTLNVTWYGNDSIIIRSYQGDTTTQLLTLDEDFMEYQQYDHFLIWVWANDTQGNTVEENLTFYVNDTAIPVVTIHSPANLAEFEDTTIQFNATCVDEATYSVEYLINDMNGSVLFNHTVLDINSTTYNNYTTLSTAAFSGSTSQTDYANYTVTCTDGHTLDNIVAYVEDVNDYTKKYYFEDFEPVTVEVDSGDLEFFSTELEYDRYTFKMKYTDKKLKIKFTVYAENIRSVDNSDYACHVVMGSPVGDIWFDTEPENGDGN